MQAGGPMAARRDEPCADGAAGVDAVDLERGRGFRLVVDFERAGRGTPASAAGARIWTHGDLLRADALREELGLGAEVDEATTLLRGYARWGTGLFERILGEVACVTWDAASGSLVAATDPWGTRPIFYAQQGPLLAVSTDTRSLRSLGWVGNEVDRASIVAYLLDLPTPPEATMYRGIRRLPAGHLLSARSGRTQVRRYFGPRFPADSAVRTRADFVECFRSTLEQATADRLRDATEPALLMSGGFDSTALAAVAASLAKDGRARGLTTCSSVFPGLPCDEEKRIRLVLSTLSMRSRLVSPIARRISLAEAREDVQRHDLPHFHSQRPIFEAEWQELRALGADIVLTGLGGDEVATDWQYHVDLVRNAGVLGLPAAVRSVARIERTGPLAAASMVLHALGARRPPALRRRVPFVARGLRPELWPLARALAEPESPPRVGFDAHAKEIRFRLMSHPRSQAAYAWWVREGAAAGFTIRSPFQDRRLVELVLGTPAELQPRTFDRGEYKPSLVQSVGALLPRELTSGYWKVHFGAFHTLVEAASLRRLAAELDGEGPWLADEFVPNARLLINMDSPRRPRRQSQLDSTRNLVALEMWLRSLVSQDRWR